MSVLTIPALEDAIPSALELTRGLNQPQSQLIQLFSSFVMPKTARLCQAKVTLNNGSMVSAFAMLFVILIENSASASVDKTSIGDLPVSTLVLLFMLN